MTQTGGLVVLYAWLIFAALLAILAWLLLRHEQDPLHDLARGRPDDGDAPPGTGAPPPARTSREHRSDSLSGRAARKSGDARPG